MLIWSRLSRYMNDTSYTRLVEISQVWKDIRFCRKICSLLWILELPLITVNPFAKVERCSDHVEITMIQMDVLRSGGKHHKREKLIRRIVD